jgi:16S rRNA (guanine527-N7)-methyltransferase
MTKPAAPPEMDASLEAGRAAAHKLFPDVSRETWTRLDVLVAQLLKWQKTINLVAPKTLPEVWTRHVADSLQVAALIPPDARIVVDLGSGGGFPGLAVAAALADRDGAEIQLVESDQRKAAFLREAARAMGVPVTVHNARIESALQSWPHGADAVTARALAPLPRLLKLAAPLLKAGTLGIFPKGRETNDELAQAEREWVLRADLVPSLTDPDARVVVVSSLKPR